MIARKQSEPGCFRTRLVELCLTAVLSTGIILFGATSAWAAMYLAAGIFLLFCVYPHFPPNFLRFSAPFFLYLLAQTAFFSLNRFNSCGEVIKMLSLSCFFCLLLNTSDSFLLKLSLITVLIGLFEVFYGFAEVFTGHEHVLWIVKKNHLGYLTGTYFNRNHLAGFLELCIGLAAGGFMNQLSLRKKSSAVFWGLFFFVLTTGLFFTGSRMGVLSFAMAVIVIIYICFFKPYKASVFSPWLFLFALGILAVMWGIHPWLSRWDELPLLNADEQRLSVWKDTLRILHDYPLSGIGLGSFEWVFPKYQSPELVMAWQHAHNGYLELITEIGIPGFILFSVTAFLFSKSYFSGHVLPNEKFWYEKGVMIGVAAFLFHGLTDFNFSVTANMFTFTFLLALLFKFRKGLA